MAWRPPHWPLALVFAVAGCHAGSAGSVPPASDAGVSDATRGNDGAVSADARADTGLDADAASPEPDAQESPEASTTLANVFVVNATSDAKATPVRICIGYGDPANGGAIIVTGGLNAFPDAPRSPDFAMAGLYPGYGVRLADDPQLATFDPAYRTFSVFVIDATQIAADTADGGPDAGGEVPCEGLIGTDGLGLSGVGGGSLQIGSQYWYVGTVQSCQDNPAGCLLRGTSWVVAVTGCAPGENASEAARCPQDYEVATGDLSLTVWQLDGVTPVDGGIGAQIANASLAWDTVTRDVGADTWAGFWTQPASGSPTLVPITQTSPFATLTPQTLATMPALPYDGGAGFGVEMVLGGSPVGPGNCPAVGPCVPPLLESFPAIDGLTYRSPPPGGSFAVGEGYVFVLVGDPLQPAYVNPQDGGVATPSTGVFNGKSPHLLAFPSYDP